MEYNPALCKEKHKRTDERLDTHERRINNHSERIDKLELSQGRTEEIVKNLCEKIDGLIVTMRWMIGLFATALTGFFVWVVQQLVAGRMG